MTPEELMMRYKRETLMDMTRPLKDWLQQHRSNPYPTKEQKLELSKESNMTMTQICNWFANARRRLKHNVPGSERPADGQGNGSDGPPADGSRESEDSAWESGNEEEQQNGAVNAAVQSSFSLAQTAAIAAALQQASLYQGLPSDQAFINPSLLAVLAASSQQAALSNMTSSPQATLSTISLPQSSLAALKPTPQGVLSGISVPQSIPSVLTASQNALSALTVPTGALVGLNTTSQSLHPAFNTPIAAFTSSSITRSALSSMSQASHSTTPQSVLTSLAATQSSHLSAVVNSQNPAHGTMFHPVAALLALSPDGIGQYLNALIASSVANNIADAQRDSSSTSIKQSSHIISLNHSTVAQEKMESKPNCDTATNKFKNNLLARYLVGQGSDCPLDLTHKGRDSRGSLTEAEDLMLYELAHTKGATESTLTLTPSSSPASDYMAPVEDMVANVGHAMPYDSNMAMPSSAQVDQDLLLKEMSAIMTLTSMAMSRANKT